MGLPFFTIGLTMTWTLMLISLTGETFAVVLGCAAGICGMAALAVRRDRTVPVVMVTVFCACMLFCIKTDFEVKPAERFAGSEQNVSGIITGMEAPSSSGAKRYIVRITDGEMKGLKVRLSVKNPEAGINDEICFQGRFFTLDRKQNGIYLGCYPLGTVEVTGTGSGLFLKLMKKAYELRLYTGNTLSENLSDDCSSVLMGMLIGDKSALSSDTYGLFQTAGLAHLLAVSGFHTSLWSVLVYRELLRRGAGLKLSAFVSLIFVAVFVAVTGFSRSALRAGIMTAVFLLGRMADLQPDSKNSLGFAATVILLLNPFAGGDAGFLLSFFATLGILTAYPVLKWETEKRLKKHVHNSMVRSRMEIVLSALLVTVSALVFTLPVTMLYFGSFSPAAPLANLVAAPAATASILLSGCGVMLSAFPVLCAFRHPLFIVSGVLVKAVLSICRLTGALPFSTVDTGTDFFAAGVAAALILTGFSLILKADAKRTAVLSVLLIAASVLSHYVFLNIELPF